MIKTADLIKRIRAMSHDEQELEYSNEDIMLYVNDGIRFVRRIIMDIYPSMLVDVEADGVLDIGENTIYTFEPIAQIVNLWVAGRRIEVINPRSLKDARYMDVPRGYYLSGYDKIKVWPLPKMPVDYHLEAIRDFEPMSIEDEELPIPANIEDFVYEYCVLRASFTNEFDMSQETQLMTTIINGIQTTLRPFAAPSVQLRGYW